MSLKNAVAANAAIAWKAASSQPIVGLPTPRCGACGQDVIGAQKALGIGRQHVVDGKRRNCLLLAGDPGITRVPSPAIAQMRAIIAAPGGFRLGEISIIGAVSTARSNRAGFLASA